MFENEEIIMRDFWRIDRDANGREILSGLSFEETHEFVQMCTEVSIWKERYNFLIKKHEAAVDMRIQDQKNVVPFNIKQEKN